MSLRGRYAEEGGEMTKELIRGKSLQLGGQRVRLDEKMTSSWDVTKTTDESSREKT